MGKPSRSAVHLPHNYPQLQNLIKRDAESYRDEFLQQYQHFKSSLAILRMRPDSVEDHFEPLVTFLAHVVPMYEAEAKEFPETLFELLGNEVMVLVPSLRRCLVQCLLLLRKRKLVDLERLLRLLFGLFRIKDKLLRELLYDSIIGEVKRANTPHRNNALNKTLAGMMFGILQPTSIDGETKRSGPARNDAPEAIAAHKALQVIIELYRRGIWNDPKTVNVVAQACTGQISHKVTVTALNFFLGRMKKRAALSLADDDGSEGEDASDATDESEGEGKPSLKEMMYKMKVAGSTKARMTRLKRYMAASKRNKAGKEAAKQNTAFAAIHLLNDPYGLVERLYAQLKKSNDSLEFKLLMLNVITRAIAGHKLIFLDIYSYLLRYIQPHQKNVSQVLAYASQASHELVPPECLAPLLKAIANNFVSDHCRNEVIAAGLNGLTQICMRCPLAMDAVLLQDLAAYKGYNDRSVMMAARGLIGVYREKNPELLHRKDRGKEASMALQRGTMAAPAVYGQEVVQTDLEGAEFFAPKIRKREFKEMVEDDDEDEDDGADMDEEGWVELVDDDSDLEECEESTDEDEEEAESENPARANFKAAEVNEMLSLAATKIFTPEDFARLKRKRIEAQIAASAASDPRKGLVAKKLKKGAVESDSESYSEVADEDEEESGPTEVVRPKTIAALAKKPKADYATRMASIEEGRKGRREFGSKRGKETRGSTTNREKAKRKNAIMLAHKYEVKLKRKRSFREVQAVKRAHITRQKKMK